MQITDHFTHIAKTIPTKNQAAKPTANTLFYNYDGIPKTIHTDEGAYFENHLISEYCQITRMNKSRTTPYYPMGNGICERFNRTPLRC